MDSKTHELGIIEKGSSDRGAVIASQELGNGTVNRDEAEMAYYGKRQQLKRNFGFLSIAGFVCSLLSTWEGMFAVFLYGFQNGGPAGLVYGYIFCWIGTLAVVASMSELASMMPLSGGQYHWVSILAPPRWAKFLSYITGWVTVIGWQAAQASVAFLGATIIQGLAVLNYDSYVPKRWHGTLILYALMAIIVFTNTYLARWLPRIEGLVLCLHILGFFGIIIPLVYLAPHGSAHDVFATFINGGGWKSNGLSFFVGIVTSVFSFLGADSACHMAEEIYNASTIVPWAMIASVMLNGVLGFAALIAILFCLGNIDDAFASPTGYPFIEIFAQGVNSKAGATGMVSVLLVLIIAATVGIMATASRLLWSFARDGGVPGSKYISKVHAPTALPLYSIFVTCMISLLLALINIGSTTALNAIVSVNCAAFFSSYMFPIGLILFRRLRNDSEKDQIHWGPWKMGPVIGPIVNAVALIYAILALFFSFFPATSTVTPVSMNWSCLIYGASIIFSVLFYLLFGKHGYKWPIVDPIRRRQ
ncbi:amino acid/polyamine transporter I [Xylogone sp. PMI_703]|nr:amino acid/polyamine transporter I [Xylogone sp. PMI_703]